MDKKILKKYKGYKYGVGLEHEMYIFHAPTKAIKDKEDIKSITLAPTEAYQVMILNNKNISNKIKNKIKKVPYEPTGRICNGKVVLNSLPGVWIDKERMPEFITEKPISVIGKKTRTLFSYADELKRREIQYIDHITEGVDKIFQNKMNKYGSFIEYPFGMSSYIKLPKNYKYKTYKFREGVYKDYTGSFHITLTLPYTDKMKLSNFISMHQNFANMIQWLEPLMVSAYFSADDRSMGTQKKRIRGSFRVMRIGWGNFAGSDVSKFKEGIGRYADIVPKWRDGLDFEGVKTVNQCKDLAPRIKKREKGAVSGFSSNFRTFGSTDPERPWHRESGAGMSVGNGIELRIFDHFSTKYLDSLLQLVATVAENSRTHKCKDYVYKDDDWIKSLHNIMLEGWCAQITPGYIKKLRKNLNLKINTSSLQAYDVFKTIYEELYNKNVNGDYMVILLDTWREKCVDLPKVNQRSWEFGLSLKLNNNKTLFRNMNRFLKEINSDKNIKEIKDIFFTKFTKKNWGNSFYNVLCYLETLEILKLDKNNKSEIIKVYKNKDLIESDDINGFILLQCYYSSFLIEENITGIQELRKKNV